MIGQRFTWFFRLPHVLLHAPVPEERGVQLAEVVPRDDDRAAVHVVLPVAEDGPTATELGSSHMFISVPITIWVFTVIWVSLKVPAPASMSLMMRHPIAPRTRADSEASR